VVILVSLTADSIYYAAANNVSVSSRLFSSLTVSPIVFLLFVGFAFLLAETIGRWGEASGTRSLRA
jgi:hypothetical protein